MAYDILVGDRFYHNNFSTRMGHSLPDYLIVTDVGKEFITAKYENHYINTNDRLFAIKFLYDDSNLNPKAKDPTWVFVKALKNEE